MDARRVEPEQNYQVALAAWHVAMSTDDEPRLQAAVEALAVARTAAVKAEVAYGADAPLGIAARAHRA